MGISAESLWWKHRIVAYLLRKFSGKVEQQSKEWSITTLFNWTPKNGLKKLQKTVENSRKLMNFVDVMDLKRGWSLLRLPHFPIILWFKDDGKIRWWTMSIINRLIMVDSDDDQRYVCLLQSKLESMLDLRSFEQFSLPTPRLSEVRLFAPVAGWLSLKWKRIVALCKHGLLFLSRVVQSNTNYHIKRPWKSVIKWITASSLIDHIPRRTRSNIWRRRWGGYWNSWWHMMLFYW